MKKCHSQVLDVFGQYSTIFLIATKKRVTKKFSHPLFCFRGHCHDSVIDSYRAKKMAIILKNK